MNLTEEVEERDPERTSSSKRQSIVMERKQQLDGYIDYIKDKNIFKCKLSGED